MYRPWYELNNLGITVQSFSSCPCKVWAHLASHSMDKSSVPQRYSSSVLLRLEMSGVIPPDSHMPSWHSQGLECYTFTRWRWAVSFTLRWTECWVAPGPAQMLWRKKSLFSLPTIEPWFLGCPAYCWLTVDSKVQAVCAVNKTVHTVQKIRNAA